MPNSGPKSHKNSQTTGNSKTIWIILPILLLFVSITSFLAGTHIGRATDHRLGQMLDTIVLSPENEAVNPNRIDFSGQIFYTDGSPCANRVIELHSDPRRTTTDSEGVFHFKDVETGTHNLALLDDSGRQESQVEIQIDRESGIQTGKVTGNAEAYQLAVSENVIAVHIRLQLDENDGITVAPDVYTRDAGADHYKDTSGKTAKGKKMTDKEICGMAEDILETLRKPSDKIENVPPIPNEVSVQKCELRGSILDIDFNKAYLKVNSLEEKLMRASIVCSLSEIEGVNAVLFTIDGESLKDSDGNSIGLMTEDDFVENTGSSPSAYQTVELTLYFANESGDKLVPQKVSARYSSNLSKEKMIVEKLMQGPESGAYPTINPNANLLGVTIKDDICYVNFDSTFLNGEYDILPKLTIYSIVNSLVEGTEATQVQITINGESKAKYMGTVDLSQPLKENLELVAADDKK